MTTKFFKKRGSSERLIRYGQTGFTLVEVMIVVAVLAVVAGIAIPNFIQMLPNYRLKDATRTLFSDMQKAKITAVKTNTNCTVTFNQAIGGTTYTYVVYTDLNGNCEYDAGEAVIDQVLWPANQGFGLDSAQGGGDGLTFLDNDIGNPSISFQPNSIPTGNNGGTANGSAFLTNTNGWTRSVVVSVAGNISLQ